MSAAFEFGVEEQLDHIRRKPEAQDSAAEAEDVRVVVLTRHARGISVGAASRADPRVFVRRHAHTDAGAADKYASVAFAALYRAADLVRVVGVVDGFAVTAEIPVFDIVCVKHILDELRELYCDINELCGSDTNITVDLGLVNKTDYYTGVIIKGYLQGHGEEVLSGGRYDKLISEFGYDIPAVGFAVNVNAIQKVIEKNGVYPAMPKADAIVYAEKGCEVAAVKAANELREQGLIVENALFDDIETVREYAKEKKIAKVVVIDGSSREEE